MLAAHDMGEGQIGPCMLQAGYVVEENAWVKASRGRNLPMLRLRLSGYLYIQSTRFTDLEVLYKHDKHKMQT